VLVAVLRWAPVDGALVLQENPTTVEPNTVWLDLLNPTKEEDVLVEQTLGIAVPTREEMAEIVEKPDDTTERADRKS
jgi:Mg2+ and Co2+ transporter CorA